MSFPALTERGRVRLSMLFIGWILASPPAVAQCVTTQGGQTGSVLTVSPATVDFGVPTLADFQTGYMDSPVAVTVTINRVQAGNSFDLCIAGASALMGGAKVIGDLQWRRSDLATFNSLTTTFASVDALLNPVPATLTFTIYFRMLLPWATTGPGSYSAPILYQEFEH